MVQRPFGEALGLRWTLVVAAPESDFTAEIGRGLKASLATMALLILLGTAIAYCGGTRHRPQAEPAHAAAQSSSVAARCPSSSTARASAKCSSSRRCCTKARSSCRPSAPRSAPTPRRLQEANDTLEARVQRRTAELAASREEALAAARAKAAFLATMSHEIRTPLNGVVGMSTLLAETPLDAEQRDYLQTIRLSSDQLLAVINDVLDFSKIESGKLELEIEPVSVRGAVEEACDIAAPRAREKGLELIIDLAEEGPGAVPAAIKGDVTRLRQVLINLISNAVKFTAAGEVAVHVRRLAGDDEPGRCVLEFRVTDTGIGIAARARRRAVRGLHPGRRLDHAQVRRHRPGAGDLQAAGRADGRRDRRRERAGPGFDLLVHDGGAHHRTAASAGRDRCGAAGRHPRAGGGRPRDQCPHPHAPAAAVGNGSHRRGFWPRCARMAGARAEAAVRGHHRHAHAGDGRRGAGARDPQPAGLASHSTRAAEFGFHARGRRERPPFRRPPAQAGPPGPVVRNPVALRRPAHGRAGTARARWRPMPARTSPCWWPTTTPST